MEDLWEFSLLDSVAIVFAIYLIMFSNLATYDISLSLRSVNFSIESKAVFRAKNSTNSEVTIGVPLNLIFLMSIMISKVFKVDQKLLHQCSLENLI